MAHASGESVSGESESRASNEQASEGHMLALEQRKKKSLLGFKSWCEISEGDKGHGGARILVEIEKMKLL